MNPQLKDYIDKKRTAGATDEQISANLISAGWAPEMVHDALQSSKPDDVPPPPPTPVIAPVIQSNPVVEPGRQTVTLPESKVQAGGYAAQYLIMLLSLWIATGSLIQLLLYVVGAFGPSDDLVEVTSVFNIIWSVALLISLPLMTFLFLHLKAREAKEPRLKQNGVRKFGIYTALVIAVLSLLIQIAWSVLATVGGNTIATAIADSVIAVVVIGPIIGYFVHDLRKAK